MRSSSPDTFNFFVPLSTLEKAGNDADGNPIMRIGGVASTNSEDADGEFLSPDGFDLSRLTKSGYFNWQHQTNSNPESVIGHPDLAEIRNGKLYVEGNLYGNSAMARKVYALQKALEQEGGGRSLGFSIEGKATHRDPHNPKKVLKALLTGIAVTPTPKNTDTLMSIMKGEGSGMEPEYDEEVEGVLLRVHTEEGEDATLTKEGEILLEKSVENTVLGSEEKKNKKNKSKNLQGSDGVSRFEPYLSKSQVYVQLMPYVTGPEQVRSLYTVIGTLHAGDMAELNKEDIQKALANIALLGKLDVDSLTKGAVSAALGADSEEVGPPSGQASLFDNELQKSETEVALEKAEANATALREKLAQEKDKPAAAKEEEPESEEDTVTKGEIEDLLTKGFDAFANSLSTQQAPIFESISELTKSLLSETQDLRKSFTEISESNAALGRQVEELKKMPVGGKSVISKGYQGNELSGQSADNHRPEGKRLNVDDREQKAQLVKALSGDIGYGTDNYNSELGRDVAKLEATGTVTENILNAAHKRGITVVRS